VKIQGYAGDPQDFLSWQMANREQPRMKAYQFDFVRQLKREHQKCALSGRYDDFSWYEEGRRSLQGAPSFTLCNGQVPGYECAPNYKCVEVTDRSWFNGANAESVGCARCGSSSN